MLNEKYQALLDQYDISVSHTRRGRGCVLCFGENDVYALSQTSLSEERLGAVSEWTLAMHDHHFYKTDQYILNKDGYFLTFDRYYETFAQAFIIIVLLFLFHLKILENIHPFPHIMSKNIWN